MTKFNVSVMLTGNSKKLQSALVASGAAATATGFKFDEFAKKLTKRFAQIGVAAATAGAVVTGGFLVSSIKTFIQYEEQLVRINAIMGNTATESALLSEEIRRVAAASRFTATETANAAQVLALAGLEMGELIGDPGSGTMGAVEALAKFSEAAGTDVETAAGIAIASVKAFRLETAEMGRVMDVMVNTFTRSFTDLELLGQSMKFLGPTAAAAGISIEEAAAAVGALGNAGLQGTIAGTGLRMAINKLLSPTEDARRTMDSLGLSFVTLTPAGQAAQGTFRDLSTRVARSRREMEQMTAASRALQGQLSDFSIEEQRNQIAIGRIRQKASRENRELTDAEIEQIRKLEMANTDLGLKQAELNIESQLLQRSMTETSRSLKEMEDASADANKTMNSQVMGLTSLTDVVNQLEASGATTAQILEIFSVRGGTAVQALMAQKQAFIDLADSNEESAGRLDQMLLDLEGSTARRLDIIKSNFEETKLVVAEAFLDALDMDAVLAAMENFGTAIRENKEDFAALGRTVQQDFVPLLLKLPDLVDDFTSAMNTLRPLLTVLSGFVKIIGGLLFVIMKVIDGIGSIIGSLTGNGTVGRAVSAAGTGAAAGAGVGAAFGGVGAGPGAIIGAIAGLGGVFLADGGVVTKPTLAVVGEAGPEAVIPLNSSQGRALTGGGASGTSINFGSITINGANMTPEDVRSVIKTEMPRVIKSSYANGARGVV